MMRKLVSMDDRFDVRPGCANSFLKIVDNSKVGCTFAGNLAVRRRPVCGCTVYKQPDVIYKE